MISDYSFYRHEVCAEAASVFPNCEWIVRFAKKEVTRFIFGACILRSGFRKM